MSDGPNGTDDRDDRPSGHTRQFYSDRADEEPAEGTLPSTVQAGGPFEYVLDGDESVIGAVTTAVSAVEGCTPTDLAPLYDAADPGVLETLTRQRGSGDGSYPRIAFPYAGYLVVIRGSERLLVVEDW